MSALAGCKILRELSKLEDETESKMAMKKLAQKFEDLAHGTDDHDCLLTYLSVCMHASSLLNPLQSEPERFCLHA